MSTSRPSSSGRQVRGGRRSPSCSPSCAAAVGVSPRAPALPAARAALRSRLEPPRPRPRAPVPSLRRARPDGARRRRHRRLLRRRRRHRPARAPGPPGCPGASTSTAFSGSGFSDGPAPAGPSRTPTARPGAVAGHPGALVVVEGGLNDHDADRPRHRARVRPADARARRPPRARRGPAAGARPGRRRAAGRRGARAHRDRPSGRRTSRWPTPTSTTSTTACTPR